jgi:hypothetical protein
MRYIQAVGLMCAVVCTMVAVGASSASASLFLAHPPGRVLIKALNNHIFTTGPEKQFVTTCTTVSVSEPPESVAALRSLNLEIHTKYDGCTFNGLVAATVSTARWFYSADNGLVRLLNIFTIIPTGLACEIKILSASNQDLFTAKYLNVGRELEIDHNIANLSSEGAGAVCAYALENKGTYTGVTLVALENGGLLRWDQ